MKSTFLTAAQIGCENFEDKFFNTDKQTYIFIGNDTPDFESVMEIDKVIEFLKTSKEKGANYVSFYERSFGTQLKSLEIKTPNEITIKEHKDSIIQSKNERIAYYQKMIAQLEEQISSSNNLLA